MQIGNHNISKRTMSKIIKRAKKGCVICGWIEASGDLHHIIPIKKGGTGELQNLVLLCPNCHRKAHNKYFTKEYLQPLSIYYTFSDWETYYNISSHSELRLSYSPRSKRKYYCKCGKEMARNAKQCRGCRHEIQRSSRSLIDLETLLIEVKELGCKAVGEKYGVGPDTIRQRIKNAKKYREEQEKKLLQ